MRTLDEVIYAYEQCASTNFEEGCGNCVYHDVPHGACKIKRNKDALHYLYELKQFRKTPLMQGIHKMQREQALYPVEDWGEGGEIGNQKSEFGNRESGIGNR